MVMLSWKRGETSEVIADFADYVLPFFSRGTLNASSCYQSEQFGDPFRYWVKMQKQLPGKVPPPFGRIQIERLKLGGTSADDPVGIWIEMRPPQPKQELQRKQANAIHFPTCNGV
jgi:hypothetical protein